jgi:ornithine cyclodeaminase/alanine dehydrogenase-like protein (mu-crystallin family)
MQKLLLFAAIKALTAVRSIQKAYLYDVEECVAQDLAKSLVKETDISVEVVSDLKKALVLSDICVTCTPVKKYFIASGDVKPGTFIAAVGSDNEEKQELDPKLLKESRLVVDSIDQASKIGELHHALDQGILTRNDVYAELGELIAGTRLIKNLEEGIIIFDSTGTALQDVAAAAIVYEKAFKKSKSAKFSFA